MGESKVYPIRIWGDLEKHLNDIKKDNPDINLSEYCRQLMRRGAGLGSVLPPVVPPIQDFEIHAISGSVTRTEKEYGLDELEANLDNIDF